MTEFERKCYGVSEQQMREVYLNGLTARLSGPEMVVMGMLSDCQEMLEHNYSKEDIRQYLNRAKFILGEMMQDKGDYNA
jgi:hypothetical protein